ncbi:MAG: ACP S-malonyltransferase [Alphaproteobacteria bacterium]|nr:ACP S-malonyltransferase [Alphaproteobacteria bacterium]MCB1551056.1 ACP S-malonyltransferase [Alphaproteobacteria bacterium]MCB9985504.1 ACP S-malonyltransferase [Micavibrio sp.]
MRAFVFPGQGSQFIGMGKDLAEAFIEAREVFQEIDDALDQHLFKLMTEGADSDLNLTENTQPALMAVSMAVVKTLTGQGGIDLAKSASFVAGHSLGEYSALTAVEAFDISTTARLLKLRGQEMQKAVPIGIGAMAAILGLDLADIEAITKEANTKTKNGETVQSANDNSPGQVVVSGHAGAVAIAMELATAKGAKRALQLPVSAPFHCRLMQPAADAMERALADTTIAPPILPIVANVTASAITTPQDIRRLLVEQVTGMVRWRESVTWMKDQGVTEIIELGAGKVLSGLIKRIEKDVSSESVGTPDQIEALIQKLS